MRLPIDPVLYAAIENSIHRQLRHGQGPWDSVNTAAGMHAWWDVDADLERSMQHAALMKHQRPRSTIADLDLDGLVTVQTDGRAWKLSDVMDHSIHDLQADRNKKPEQVSRSTCDGQGSSSSALPLAVKTTAVLTQCL